MTVNRTTLLDLPLPVSGTESGTWGDTTNNGLTQYLDIAIAGMSNLTSANFTAGALTIETTEGDSSATNISATSAQYAGFRVTSLAVNSTITVGNTGTTLGRSYRLINADSTYTLTFKATGQTGVTLQPGQSAVVAFNGTDYVFVGSVGPGSALNTPLAVIGNATAGAEIRLPEDTDNGSNYVAIKAPDNIASNATLTAPAVTDTLATIGTAQTFTAAQTFRAANAIRSEAASTQDAVVIAGRAGGTSSYAATITPTTLSASRTITLPNADINFTTGLGVANGGTGTTTLTANNVILGNGASAVQFVAPGANGNVLTSNGTTWTSAAASASLLGATDSASPFETSLGYQAGNVNTGANNTFIGYQAGLSNTTGTHNVSVGYQALDANTTGTHNVAIGSQALGANTTGTSNVAIGYAALGANTTNNENIAIGLNALNANTADGNIGIGHNALSLNSTGTGNVGIGRATLGLNTTGVNNTAVGYAALDANTTGEQNTAMGQNALGGNTTGFLNSAFGRQSLFSNTTGQRNSGFGLEALYSNTTGNFNTAVGYRALFYTTTGSYNTAVGHNALGGNTTASNNTAIGDSAGYAVTTGTQNTLLGVNAGYSGTNLTTGSNNTILGYNATSTSATVSNEITLGNSSVATLRCQVTTITALSDVRDKTNINELPAGLGFVKALRPVEFDWNMRDGGKVGEHDTGFIAQDLKAAQEATGINIPGLVYESNPDRLEAGYGKLIPVLVKAIQELSAEVESLKSKLKRD